MKIKSEYPGSSGVYEGNTDFAYGGGEVGGLVAPAYWRTPPKQHAVPKAQRKQPPAPRTGGLGPIRLPTHSASSDGISAGPAQYYMSTQARSRTGRRLDQLFPCDVCGKMFTTKMGLYYHSPEHTGEWKHTCPVCDKGFMQLAKYNSHMQQHRKRHTQF